MFVVQEDLSVEGQLPACQQVQGKGPSRGAKVNKSEQVWRDRGIPSVHVVGVGGGAYVIYHMRNHPPNRLTDTTENYVCSR